MPLPSYISFDYLDAKRAKIKELLTYIEERLEELEEEKEELKEFQEKDKERRCLEYALYQRELSDVGQQLEEVCISAKPALPMLAHSYVIEIESNRKEEMNDSNKKRAEYTAREKKTEVGLNPFFFYARSVELFYMFFAPTGAERGTCKSPLSALCDIS